MSTVEVNRSELQTLDRPPAGWHLLTVAPIGETARCRDWVALMVDVDPADLKNCQVDFPALFWVHPKEYRPGERRASQCWVTIPGKHRGQNAAWDAACDMVEVRH